MKLLGKALAVIFSPFLFLVSCGPVVMYYDPAPAEKKLHLSGTVRDYVTSNVIQNVRIRLLEESSVAAENFSSDIGVYTFAKDISYYVKTYTLTADFTNQISLYTPITTNLNLPSGDLVTNIDFYLQ